MELGSMRIGRRQMLRLAAGAAAAAASPLGMLFGGEAARGFKIGACDWCLGKGDPSALDVAKEIGLDGIQVNMGSAGNGMHLRRPELQKAYRDRARELSLELGSLAMGETNSVNLVTEPRAAIWLADSVEVARAIGVKVVLVAMFFRGEVAPSDAEGIRKLVDLLKEVAPRAEKAGVVLGLENYHSAADNLKVIEKVGSKAVSVYYDVGNSTDKGYDILAEIRLLAKEGRLCELHAKDGPHLFGAPGSRVDFGKVREALDGSGWRGWIQIEGAAPHGVVPDYRANLAHLRTFFPREGK